MTMELERNARKQICVSARLFENAYQVEGKRFLETPSDAIHLAIDPRPRSAECAKLFEKRCRVSLEYSKIFR